MAEIFVRAATPGDLPTIVEFNRRLALETESLILDGPTLEAGVRAALSDASKARYFVACAADGQVVGQMMHTYEWSDWRNGDIWWLQSVYVHPDYRSLGVFRRLFDFVAERAREDSNVVGLRLYVEDHNERAQAVYERIGLKTAGYGVMEHVWRRAPRKTDS
jgi:ribosomal protein S18 acetylase RimI-like enzyme